MLRILSIFRSSFSFQNIFFTWDITSHNNIILKMVFRKVKRWHYLYMNKKSFVFHVLYFHFLFHIYIYISSSSSCHAISMDIPDPLFPHLPIVHRFRQVLRATPRILTELLQVGSSWSPCFCSTMCRGP